MEFHSKSLGDQYTLHPRSGHRRQIFVTGKASSGLQDDT
uniref:Uncharacterized protein n=1 Tax=Setaria italica TaxID=4555 RepID=K3ZG78_SETIT